MKWLLILVAALCVGSLAAAQAAALPQEKEERVKFDPKRDPDKDLAVALAKAKRQKKRVLLDVGGEWCIWCKKLDEFFLANKDAKQLLENNYIAVKVNFSPENENVKFLSRYPKIKAYPHIFILDENGKVLVSQDTGELETGDHHDHAKVTAFLKKWAPK